LRRSNHVQKKDILKNISKGDTPADERGLMYTCNCGWLDLGHLSSPQEPRIEIGATNLWKQDWQLISRQ
jgi:hypothetical protein